MEKNFFNKKILIVDDSLTIRNLIEGFLKHLQYENVDIASNGEEAKRKIEDNCYDMVITDFDMPGLKGDKLLEFIKKDYPDTIVIMLTGQAEKDIVVKLMRIADNYLVKDDIEKMQVDLSLIVHEAFRVTQLAKDNEELLNKLKEKNEQIENELTIARDIQKSMLPVIPELKNYQIAIKYKPLSTIGGDFYDIKKIGNSIYALFFVDITGHGIPASLLTVATKVFFESISYNSLFHTNDIASLLDKKITGVFPTDKFANGFVLIINEEDDEIIYTNVSNIPPLYITSKDIQTLNTDNLGFFGIAKSDYNVFKEKSLQMKSGEKIIIYTDGITEAKDQNFKDFSLKRLKNLVRDNYKLDADSLVKLIYEKIMEHTQEKITDDITILIIEKK